MADKKSIIPEALERANDSVNSGSEYVTIKTYADMYNISPLLLLEDILEGKYQSAICLISTDEECKSSFSEKNKPKGMVSRSPDYILVKEYAANHGVQPSTVMKKIHQGKYKTAIKESNRWYIHKDDEEIRLLNGYVTAKEYADRHGLKYSTVLRDLSLGLYPTAYKDDTHHWFLNEQDIKRDPYLSNEFEGYITAREYAERNEVHYNRLLEDIRMGVYSGYVKKKKNIFWYIKEDAKCITKEHGLKGYISAEKYAKKNNVTADLLVSDIENGMYKSAKQVDGVWYLKPQAKCYTSNQGNNPISLSKYAIHKGVDYLALIADVKNGLYNTVEQRGSYWYIDGKEECKTNKKGNGYKDFLSVGEFAKKYNVARKSVTEDVRIGVYETAIKIRTHWFIHKNEPCKTLSDDYISLAAYAKMHGLNRVKLRKDVEAGLYKSAKKKNNRWLILKNETVKESAVKPIAPDKLNYVSASQYAKNHNVKRISVLDDIKAGYYETAEFINSRWYIHKDEPCKTLTDDYITLTAYAKLHNVSRMKLVDDVNKGVYSTVIKKGSHTYIKKDEEFKSFDRRKFSQMPEYISIKEYAVINGFSYQKILNDVKEGLYSTAYCRNTRWYIDKNEPCKSTDKRKESAKSFKAVPEKKQEKTEISVAEYAKLNGISYQKALTDVKDGVYDNAYCKNNRWYINKNEPCKSIDKRKQRGKKAKSETDSEENPMLVSVADYAKLNDLPYQKVLKDVKDGLYETAVQKKSRWFLDKNESVKSKYKRRVV